MNKEPVKKRNAIKAFTGWYNEKTIKFFTRLLSVMALFGMVTIVLYFVRFWSGFRWDAFSTDQSVWGAFGDLFNGILGPVLSFAALIAALITLNQQMHELKEQEEERKNTTFENSFFNLLSNHRELVSSIIYHDKRTQIEHKGRVFFRDSVEWLRVYLIMDTCKLFCQRAADKPEAISQDFSSVISNIVSNTTIDTFFTEDRENSMQVLGKIKDGTITGSSVYDAFISAYSRQNETNRRQIVNTLITHNNIPPEARENRFDLLMQYYTSTFSLSDKLILHKSAWVAYYDEYGGESGFYFRNLRNTLGYIKEKCPAKDENSRYGKLLRAQLSRFEIALLFYNCLGDQTSTTFNRMVSKDGFNLLKGLYPTDLFDWQNWQALFDLRTEELRTRDRNDT